MLNLGQKASKHGNKRLKKVTFVQKSLKKWILGKKDSKNGYFSQEKLILCKNLRKNVYFRPEPKKFEVNFGAKYAKNPIF